MIHLIEDKAPTEILQCVVVLHKMAVLLVMAVFLIGRQDVAREIPLVRRQFFLRDSLYYIALILV